MAEDLENILTKNMTYGNAKASMIFYDAITGKHYPTSAKGYMDVMSWYCSRVCDENSPPLSLCEVPNEKCPLTVCYKFRLVGDEIETDISNELIQHMVYCIRTVLKTTVSENSHYDILTCILSEVGSRVLSTNSRSPGPNDVTSVDIRFTFPNAVCSTKYQIERIIPKIKEINLSIGRDFGIKVVDIVNRSLDDRYVLRPIPLIGSTDVPDDLAFGLPVCYESPNVDSPDNLKAADLSKCLLSSENYLYQLSGYSSSFISSEDSSFWNPLIGSMFYTLNEIPEASKSTTRTRPKEGLYNSNNTARNTLLQKDDILEMSEMFINMWKPTRLVDLFDWKVAGEAIYDASKGNEFGLELWIDLTNKAKKKLEGLIPKPFQKQSSEEMCSNTWYSFKLENNTLVNLGTIAREDNPSAYNKWHQSWYKPAMEIASSGLDYDLAVALKRYYWLEFMSTIVGRNSIVWYRFEGHRMREIPGGFSLRVLISSDFAESFRSMLNDITRDNAMRVLDPKKRDDNDTLAQNISLLINSLKTRRVKNNIMAEAADLFMVRDLGAKMDANPDLLGAPNGVFVFTDYDVSFRNGRPQDYVTRSVGCRYNENFKSTDKIVVDMEDWIMKFNCNDVDSNDYFWMMQGAFLRGVNRNKKVFCLSGEKANNSKSSVERVMEVTWGDYCDKLPAAKLNSHFENAEGASPVLAALTATRIIFVDEPSRSKPLRTDTIKMLTSDSFRSRKLHENGGKNRPLFTIIFVCNFAPEFDEKSKAIQGRWVIFPADALWSDNAPDTVEECIAKNMWPIDHNFDDKAPDFAPAWLWKAVANYPKVAKQGLRKLPIRIKHATDQYWKEKDCFYLYLHECTETVEEETVTVSFTDLYNHFIDWFRTYAPSKRIPDKIEFSCEIFQRWERPVNDLWKGKRIKISALKNSFTGIAVGFHDPMPAPTMQSAPTNYAFDTSMLFNTFAGLQQPQQVATC